MVDDEASLRTVVSSMLKEQGYSVVAAANGGQVLEMAQEQGESEIHLLITDLVMPQMSGNEPAKRIRTRRPNIQVLYISGYS